MVELFIKCVEDLNLLNQHRVNRGEMPDTKHFLKHCEIAVKDACDHIPADDVMRAQVEKCTTDTVQTICDAIAKAEKHSDRPFTHQAYEQARASVAEEVDSAFDHIMQEIAAIKIYLMAQDLSNWTDRVDDIAKVSSAAAPADHESEETTSAAHEVTEKGVSATGIEAEPEAEPADQDEDTLDAPCANVTLTVLLGMGGKSLTIDCPLNETCRDLKHRLHRRGCPRPQDQKISVDGVVEARDLSTLREIGFHNDSSVVLICAPWCDVCQGKCLCSDCHGEGRYAAGCVTCGKVRPDCKQCKGPCRCSGCHGVRVGMGHLCKVCGKRDPCWGGDTLVLKPGGGF
jgi:hypothetical protein